MNDLELLTAVTVALLTSKKFQTNFDISNALNNKLTLDDIDSILEFLYARNMLDVKEATDADGGPLNIPLYKLSFEGRFRIQELLKDNQKKESEGLQNSPKTNTNGLAEKPEQPITLDSLMEMENKFIKGMPLVKVIDHFKVFLERESNNGKPFLTESQLISFIRKAFIQIPNLPKQEFNLSRLEKGFIIKRFHQFFEFSVSNYSELNQIDKFVTLISDNFSNWERENIIPLFRPNKTKKKW